MQRHAQADIYIWSTFAGTRVCLGSCLVIGSAHVEMVQIICLWMLQMHRSLLQHSSSFSIFMGGLRGGLTTRSDSGRITRVFIGQGHPHPVMLAKGTSFLQWSRCPTTRYVGGYHPSSISFANTCLCRKAIMDDDSDNGPVVNKLVASSLELWHLTPVHADRLA